MANYTRLEVAQLMESMGLIPLFYHKDIEMVKKVVSACYDGGARLFEFTDRGDFAFEVFGELNKYVEKELPGMILGAGSVTDAATASMYMARGANFIVTPVLREDVAKVCNRRKVLWSPGCGTLTEISKAEELGCEIIKLFPGGVYGPGMVKAIKGPQPWTSVMVTGGVLPTKESIDAWFGAGASCVGMGSKLITPQIVEAGSFKSLTKNIEEVLGFIRNFRND
jgi:2-dehydro-3-deoxyphosphogluconate aldolase/(4S)-4-hydroxy-2-oxoglutarate aldolase